MSQSWINPPTTPALRSNDKPSETWELNLLSPELYDTELGTLLTVADVLLKSWSEHGNNEVRGFRDYPRLESWPFGKTPLVTITSEYKELIYNYNSAAAARLLKVGNNQSVLSTIRTGVLPISYYPGIQVAHKSVLDVNPDSEH